MLNTIAKKISIGYLAVALVLIVSGVTVYWETQELSAIDERLHDLRSPTVEATFRLLNGINESQAVLRAWLLLEDQLFLNHYRRIWREDVEESLRQLNRFAPEFTSQEARDMVHEIQREVSALRDRQAAFEIAPSHPKAPKLTRELLSAMEIRSKIEAFLENQRQYTAQEAVAQSDLIRQVNLSQVILILIGVITCIVMGAIISRVITRPIHETIGFANTIAQGNYDSTLNLSGAREIESLKDALERMRTHLEKQTWITQAQLAFYDAISGVGNVKDLAESALSTLARLIRADAGLLYLIDGSKLRVAGGVAFPDHLQPNKEVEMGESLAGRAALERKIVVVSDPDKKALSVQTMLGNIKPRQIFASPLIHNDEVVGVVELASLNEVRERDLELVNNVSLTAAIALDSVMKSDQVRNLLHETQSQAEELQAQQEELRQSNHELQSRQEELESINEELEEQQALLKTQKAQLDEKNRQLEEAQRDLAERAAELERIGKYKSEFLANMSHELRTPLNSQLILSKLLAENKEGNLTQKQIQFIETIHGTGLDLLQLINDILDLSKVEAGKLDLDIKETSVNEIISSLERDFSAQFEERGLKFTMQIDPTAPAHIRTDSLRLTQILRNLLSNAMKFTEKGEVSLTVSAATSPRYKGGVTFEVKDTGIGIPKDKTELIFQAFEQLDSATNRKFGGTGLGLAISRQLTTLLGGEISVESELGVGTTFTLTIPSEVKQERAMSPEAQPVDVQPAARARGEAKTTQASKKHCVLVVDDDPVLQKEISGLLEDAGIQAVGVTTVQAAYDILAEGETFDCLILDLKLPDMNGIELLKKMQSNPNIPPMPVIVYTAKDLNRREEEDLRKISEAIIIKGPRSIERLLDEVSLFIHRVVKELPNGERVKTVGQEKKFGGQKVLLVDDDVRNIFSLTSALEEKGLTVVIARDGREALGMLEEHSDVDLILMDIMMPVMDGYEATRQIKASNNFSHIPVIALTAKAMKEDKEMCLAAGANDYLPKPVDLDRLYTLLHVWLSNEK